MEVVQKNAGLNGSKRKYFYCGVAVFFFFLNMHPPISINYNLLHFKCHKFAQFAKIYFWHPVYSLVQNLKQHSAVTTWTQHWFSPHKQSFKLKKKKRKIKQLSLSTTRGHESAKFVSATLRQNSLKLCKYVTNSLFLSQRRQQGDLHD